MVVGDGDLTYLVIGIVALLLIVCTTIFLVSRHRRNKISATERVVTKTHRVETVSEATLPGEAARPLGGIAIPAEISTELEAVREKDLLRIRLGEVEIESSVATTRPHTLGEIQRHPPVALSAALANTRTSFFGRLKLAFSKKELLNAGELDEIEEVLYTSDLGPQTVQRLMAAVEEKMKASGSTGFENVREALKNEMLDMFATIEARSENTQGPVVSSGNGSKHFAEGSQGNGVHGVVSGNNSSPNSQPTPASNSSPNDGQPLRGFESERKIIEHAAQDYIEGLERLNIWTHKPAVLMVVGVNGAGKTTTIGKLARRIAQSGRKVLVAAGDTFRAAAGDQLRIWVDRAQVEIFAPPGVTDPSAVAFDACQTAQIKGFDVVIIDTAGRLHTQKNLMEELKKMKRVITKVLPGAPHETLLVLDANSGQNALVQAREFNTALEVTGVVLTKLDGTAKGGVALGLAFELGLPIKLIGVGEGIEDLRRFSSREFVDSII